MGKTLAVILFEVKDFQEPEPHCLIYAFRPRKSADWETAMTLLSGKHVDGAIRKLVCFFTQTGLANGSWYMHTVILKPSHYKHILLLLGHVLSARNYGNI